MKINALGFIETQGLVAAIEAADAMVKSANVRLIKQFDMAPGMVTVIVEGDVGACKAAVDAGVAAASRLGPVISRLEIPRPGEGIEDLILKYLDNAKDFGKNTNITQEGTKESEPQKNEVASTKKVTEPKKVAVAEEVIVSKALLAPVLAVDDFEKEFLNYLGEVEQGRTKREVSDRFKGYTGLNKLLKKLTDEDKIHFKQMRYALK